MGLVTLASATANGPLVAGTVQSPQINQILQSAELAQPEGTLMELTVSNLGVGANVAATSLNLLFQQGLVTDPASGQPIVPWTQYATQIAWVAAPGALTLRWIKEQAFAFILIGILISVAGYLVFRYLTGAGWDLLGNRTSSPTGSNAPFLGGSPFRIAWIPWYDALGGAVAVGVVLGGLKAVTALEENGAAAERGAHDLAQAGRRT